MPHRVTNQQLDVVPRSGVFAPALIAAAAVLACARVIGAFLLRSGELRRAGRIPARQRAYVPAHVRDRSYAAVHVGAAGLATAASEDGDDIDDMGLLAKAMSAETRTRRPLVEYIAQPVVEPDAPINDFPADLFEDPAVPGEAPVRALATIAAAGAVVAGIPAIVRPLEPWAPLLAGLAIALGAAAWWLSRRAN